jgi:hypothetical protein
MESPRATAHTAKEGVARQRQSHHLKEAKVRDEFVAHCVEDALEARSSPGHHHVPRGAVNAARAGVAHFVALRRARRPARLECDASQPRSPCTFHASEAADAP